MTVKGVYMKNRKYNHEIIKKSFNIGFQIMKKEFVLMLAVSIAYYSLPLLGIMLNVKIFNMVQVLPGNTQKIPEFVVLLIWFGVYLLFTKFHLIYYTRYFLQYGPLLKFERLARLMLHNKCDEINAVNYENPELYNYIIQARTASTNVYRIIEINIYLVGILFGSIGVLIYMKDFNPALIIFVIISNIAVLLEKIYSARQYGKTREKTMPLQLEEMAYKESLTSLNFNKEVRILSIEAFLKNKWLGPFEKRVAAEWGADKKVISVNAIAELLKFVGSFGAYAYSAYLLITGKIRLGEFTASLFAFTSLSEYTQEIFELYGYLDQFTTYVKPFFRFMEIFPDKRNERCDCGFTSLRLENVSFKYPGSEKNALEDITLEVKKGEKTAIVGKNGAGKSTLVNMILGLYDPIKGRVLYNGKEAKAIEKKDLFAGKSAVFQNVNKYKMTVAENVQLGNPQKKDLQEQMKALKESGFPLNRYSMDEKLGKEFGGIDISGGEWQRLSMARGIYKNGSFVVLDEPTSAIDPLQEAELYKKFVQLFNDKTVFLVTHRLGAVSIADKIIVLDDGKIKEHGTHEELIRKNGYYKKLWDSQVKWYQ